VTRDTLLDEIALRRASIDDAQREFAEGDMSAAELDELVVREHAAIARCEEQLAELGVATTNVASAPESSVRRHRRRYLYVALGSFAVAIAIVLVTQLALRQPGTSITGGVSGTTSQRIVQLLTEAEVDQAANSPIDALAAYNQVLALQASNVEALTQSGWLSFSAGSASHDASLVELGVHRVSRAVTEVPKDPDPRLYYAIIAASTPGDRAFAASQFRTFLRLHPTNAERAIAHPWLVELDLVAH
jgi:TolA-binding protein